MHVLSNNFLYTRKLVLVPLSLVSVFHECLKAGIRTQIFWGLYLSVNVFSTKVQIGDNLCSLVCWELNMHFFVILQKECAFFGGYEETTKQKGSTGFDTAVISCSSHAENNEASFACECKYFEYRIPNFIISTRHSPLQKWWDWARVNFVKTSRTVFSEGK